MNKIDEQKHGYVLDFNFLSSYIRFQNYPFYYVVGEEIKVSKYNQKISSPW